MHVTELAGKNNNETSITVQQNKMMVVIYVILKQTSRVIRHLPARTIKSITANLQLMVPQ